MGKNSVAIGVVSPEVIGCFTHLRPKSFQGMVEPGSIFRSEVIHKDERGDVVVSNNMPSGRQIYEPVQVFGRI